VSDGVGNDGETDDSSDRKRNPKTAPSVRQFVERLLASLSVLSATRSVNSSTRALISSRVSDGEKPSDIVSRQHERPQFLVGELGKLLVLEFVDDLVDVDLADRFDVELDVDHPVVRAGETLFGLADALRKACP